MSVELKNLKVINGNTLIGKISIFPDVPNKMVLPPKINNTNCCIFFSDLYNDYSTIQILCEKIPITKNINYHFYGTTGNCIVKLLSDRKNNNFGTIRPKNIEWKFISDIKFVNIPDFKSFFIFNKYPGLSELTNDDNKRTLLLHDLKKLHENKVFCFVSKSIYNLYDKLCVEFPFTTYKVVDDEDILAESIETLMGKIISSGKPFANGVIKCFTNEGVNNTLHSQYIDKSIVDFQALRNGIVEYTTNNNSEDGEFVIFYQYPINKIFLNEKEIEYKHIIINSVDTSISKITSMFVDFENIKYNGKKFVIDETNAIKTHYYKYKKFSDILNFNDTIYYLDMKNELNMIKNISESLLQNIRTELRYLEDKEDKGYVQIPILGKSISDGQFIRNDEHGKLFSSCF